jgi:hypothetical protein
MVAFAQICSSNLLLVSMVISNPEEEWAEAWVVQEVHLTKEAQYLKPDLFSLRRGFLWNQLGEYN